MATIKVKVNDPPSKNPFVDNLDARDILSMFAGAGTTSLADPDNQKHFARLSAIVGLPTAQKLANQVILHNQRPEVQGMNPEQRVNSFFSLGSNDPSVNSYLKNAGGLGYGAGNGFTNSPLIGNRILTGKDIGAADMANAEKIKLLVKKNIK